MKTLMIILAALLPIACGGSQKSNIMTPEERLNAQLAMGEEQAELDAANTDRFSESDTVAEEEANFDEESAQHEMKRAALNAVDCPNTFDKSQLAGYAPGKVVITMTFENNGGVKNVEVTPPYDGTAVGDCIVRAMGTVSVEPFIGPPVTKQKEVELLEPKPPKTDKKK